MCRVGQSRIYIRCTYGTFGRKLLNIPSFMVYINGSGQPYVYGIRQTFQASVEVRLKRLISTAVEMRLKFCRSTAGMC